MRSHLRRAVDSRSSTGDTIEVSSPGEPVAPITLEELQDFSALSIVDDRTDSFMRSIHVASRCF